MSLRVETLKKLRKAKRPLTSTEIAELTDRDPGAVCDALRHIMTSPGNEGNRFINFKKVGRAREYSLTPKGKELSAAEIAKILPFKFEGESPRKRRPAKKVVRNADGDVEFLPPEEIVNSVSFQESDFQEIPSSSVTIEVDPKAVTTLKITGEGADIVNVKFV